LIVNGKINRSIGSPKTIHFENL